MTKAQGRSENQTSLRPSIAIRFREGLRGHGGKPADAKIMVRGEPTQPGPEVPRGF
jgi:hypothetical protein